jgi:hypothetical protein
MDGRVAVKVCAMEVKILNSRTGHYSSAWLRLQCDVALAEQRTTVVTSSFKYQTAIRAVASSGSQSRQLIHTQLATRLANAVSRRTALTAGTRDLI